MPHTQTGIARLLSVLLLGATLAACASTTELLRDNTAAQPDTPIRSLLVVGISADEKMRQVYEQAFVEEVQQAGLTGVSSTTLLPALGDLSTSGIQERMRAFADRADAVLYVQLANLVQGRPVSPTELPADSDAGGIRLGGVDVRLNTTPVAEASAGAPPQIELEAVLYALPTQRLLWTGITATHEANDPVLVARSHARALLARWQRKNWLRAAP